MAAATIPWTASLRGTAAMEAAAVSAMATCLAFWPEWIIPMAMTCATLALTGSVKKTSSGIHFLP